MGMKVVPKAPAKKPAKAKAPAKSNPIPAPRIGKDERDWMAEDDARTLARAEEIKRDAARLREAKRVAAAKAAEYGKAAKS